MKIVIPIEPVTKKNHSQVVMIKGRPLVLPSKPCQEYERKCKPYIPKIEGKPHSRSFIQELGKIILLCSIFLKLNISIIITIALELEFNLQTYTVSTSDRFCTTPNTVSV